MALLARCEAGVGEHPAQVDDQLPDVGMSGRAMVAEDLEVGADEHAAPARRHEAMLAKA
jgi:hypothetical protein